MDKVQPEVAMATPAVFRYRVWLFAAVFVVSGTVSGLLARLAPFRDLYGILSVPADLTFPPHARVPAGEAAWFLIPLGLSLAGGLVRAWGTSYLRGHVMMDARLHSERLIIAGPFRWCRNPLYAGNLLIGAAYGFLMPPPGILLTVAGMAGMGIALARIEARALEKEHGDAYRAYAAKVPAFLPRPPAADLPRGADVRPDWANGLASEAAHPLAVLYFTAIVLGWWQAAIAMAGALVLFMVWRRSVNRRRRGETA
jgi:protein-S-isoprenylcysteine O-methyltransferase Ste14